jgi:hypothetical protein
MASLSLSLTKNQKPIIKNDNCQADPITASPPPGPSSPAQAQAQKSKAKKAAGKLQRLFNSTLIARISFLFLLRSSLNLFQSARRSYQFF